MTCPPFNLFPPVIHTSGERHAELNCFMQTSALPRRRIRALYYQSVSIEENLVTNVTPLATSVVGGIGTGWRGELSPLRHC